MKLNNENLRKILVEPGYISAADFDEAAKKAWGNKSPLPEVLVDNALIKDEQLGQLIAQASGYNFINLRKEQLDQSLSALIPEAVVRSKGVIAFARDKDNLKVAMVDPEDIETRRIIEKKLGQKINPYYITRRDLDNALLSYRASLEEEYLKILAEAEQSVNSAQDKEEVIIKIVDLLMEYGHNNSASDVHIEPYSGSLHVRFRIDGLLHKVLEIPKAYAEALIARIKILAKLRIDEHQAAQDGKFRFAVNNQKIDVRVSIVPVNEGENVVMRLLSSEARQMSLNGLGVSSSDLKKIKLAMSSSSSMIVVAGPTGSGKTTTLYEVIKILNTEDVHVSTIEDPIEYDIEGISQIQVNPKTNLTFAAGLRSIVRQDPDIIMVGEIRDEETAQIAVNSAMTGHLVLSTLHANDTATAIPRLLEMGIEPFLLASSLRIIIAQRLVRLICEKCRYSYEISTEERDTIANYQNLNRILAAHGKTDLTKLTLFKGRGCKVCADTGYEGRIGLFEVLDITQPIKELIVKRASSNDIMAAAISFFGMTTMLEDGVNKILNGITTLEEVLRVIQE